MSHQDASGVIMKPVQCRLSIGIAAVVAAMAGSWLTWASAGDRAGGMTIAQAQEPAPSPAGQVSEMRVTHRSGQTVLTWREVAAAALPEQPRVDLIERLRASTDEARYRIYRSASPIRTLDGLQPIAEVSTASAWNVAIEGRNPEAKARRFVVREGEPPVAAGTAILVYNPPTAGEFHYAVTSVSRGREQRLLTPANSTARAIGETVGRGEPILQRREKPAGFMHVERPSSLEYYVRWEVAPNTSKPGKPYDYLVAVPERPSKPAPVGIHLHAWGANMESGYGWWFNAEQGAILLAPNQALGNRLPAPTIP
jgi:hypothetical protein